MSYAVARRPAQVAVALATVAVTGAALMTPSYADHGGSAQQGQATRGQASRAAHAKPQQRQSIRAAVRQVDRLNHEAEQASERYNTVRATMQQARGRLARVRADMAREAASAATLHASLVAQAVAAFEGANLSTTVKLVVANNPDEFLTGLTTVAAITADQGAMLNAYESTRHQLSAQRARVHADVVGIAGAQQQLGVEKASLDKKAAQAQAVLARLRAQQRQARVERRRQARQDARAAARARAAAATAAAPSRSATRPPATTTPPPAPAPSSGRGGAAVAFALAQLGDPYVYGAAGPDAWDCSGLTMGAWAAAGLSIPHSASMQTAVGVPVSASALQPGDLVFYYSPISHVALYIGNGQVVHAPHPGSSVEVVPLSSMPIAMAVRPG